MTRKDYILLADAIAGIDIKMHLSPETIREIIANAIARALKSDNPRFDLGRFMLRAAKR